MDYRPLLLAMLALVGACSAPPLQPTTPEAQAQRVLCDRSYPVGSALPRKECVAALSDDERQRLSSELQDRFKPRTVQVPSGGK
jgi:hypothetical protein